MSPERRRWQLAAANVNALLASQGQATPPVDLRRLSEALGVTRISFGPIAADAMLQAERGGLRVVLKDGVARARSRFSWAHELAHVLLDRPPDGAAAYRAASEKEIENDCNSLAAEILMPLEMFNDAVMSVGYGLACVPILARMFQTSLTATAIRMVKTHSRECLLSVWSTRGPEQRRPRLMWSVGGGHGQRLKGARITWDAQGAIVPEGVDMAFRERGVMRTTEPLLAEVPFSRGALQAVEVPTESWAYGTGQHRTVLSLAYLAAR